VSKTVVFLDTNILRAIFISVVNGKHWRQEYGLSSGNFRLITSQKCIIEMYGILKTSILTSDLAIYGCKYSSPKGEDSILRRILDGDEFVVPPWDRTLGEVKTRVYTLTKKGVQYATATTIYSRV